MAPIRMAWRHESELALVRDWFFPHHVVADPYSSPLKDMRQRAVDKVNLWQFKTSLIPHAISATQTLTDALLHDEQPQREEYISNPAMKGIYAQAFLRFVNGFVDRDVAKSIASDFTSDEDDRSTRLKGGESSMYAYALTIGMPERFVDLRHQVSHGQVPELEYLRRMAEKALEWLYEKWWKRNAKGDPDRALREEEYRQSLIEGLRRREIGEADASGDDPQLCGPKYREQTKESHALPGIDLIRGGVADSMVEGHENGQKRKREDVVYNDLT